MILMIGLGAAILVAGGLVVYGVISSRNQPSVVQERLGRYTDATAIKQVAVTAPTTTGKPRTSPVGEFLNNLLRGQSFFDKVQARLNAADLKMNVGEFFALALISSLVGIVVGFLLAVIPDCASRRGDAIITCFITRNYIDAAVVGIVGAGAGFYAPNFYVDFRKGQRLQAFDNQLGDTLNLLVNALRSGYSVLQAMEAVSKELPPPVNVEFKRVVQEIQLGLPMETALDHLLDRINSEDLDLVITAINIQREVGGNLAEILDVISHTIRERIRIKGEIAVLTSQGMATGWAITLMPFILMGILFLVNRPYIMEFFVAKNQPCGWGMLIVAVIMIAIGGFVISKIVSIEV
jgi:tight adherence protein B